MNAATFRIRIVKDAHIESGRYWRGERLDLDAQVLRQLVRRRAARLIADRDLPLVLAELQATAR